MQQPSPRSSAHHPSPLPSTPRPRSGRRHRLSAVAALGLTGLLAGLLSGCGTGATKGAYSQNLAPGKDFVAASGNWLLTSSSPRLRAVSGSLLVSGSVVSGVLHPVAGTCAGSDAAASVSGSITEDGLLTLSAANFAGGTLSLRGTLSPDLHSLSNPSLTITGGACATPLGNLGSAVPSPRDNPGTSAQQYQALTGTYTGTLTSDFGGTLAVTATIAQGASPDADGNYHLTGNASFSDTSCLSSPVLTDSVVSGNTVSVTYTDPHTGNTVSGSGTFSSDAQTLSISSWTLTGSCGSDRGAGLFTRSTH